MNKEDWEKQLQVSREQKDSFMSDHPQSPVPPEERKDFEGLEYFPPNWDYRFVLDLIEHEKKSKINMPDTSGNYQEFIRWGVFGFSLKGKKCELHAYKSKPNDKRLFIPFQDKTSGNQTYSSGRYLDLEEEEDKISNGKWILDLNEAYNPFCAYSEAYICPLVPPENRLEVEVKAGEKYGS